MTSNYEAFFQNKVFAVVGHDKKRPFPRLTFAGLLRQDKTAFAIDPSVEEIDGKATYSDLDSLPEAPEAIVLEVPVEESRDWVERAAKAGIKDLWFHMNTESPEALRLAADSGMNVRTGTCAVQYVDDSFPHSGHKLIRKLLGRW